MFTLNDLEEIRKLIYSKKQQIKRIYWREEKFKMWERCIKLNKKLNTLNNLNEKIKEIKKKNN
tara:strand:+ start:286 stop:474 length:189 start_codon:yes stop_codon:yes gene_type:complete